MLGSSDSEYELTSGLNLGDRVYLYPIAHRFNTRTTCTN